MEKDPAFEKELWYHKEETIAAIHTLLDQWKHFDSVEMFIISNGEVIKDIRNISQLAHLASEIMFGAYPYTLLVNNELINKNVISGSISSAKKKAVRAIIQGENALNNYGLQYLSPEYIAVRSVLAKNGFIKTEDCSEVNCLANGETPHSKVRDYLKDVIARAQRSSIDIGEVYSTLKNPPFGLRDGYLSLVLAVLFAPHQKSLIITSHGAEQELSAELYEEMIKRPDDYCFTVAAWDEAQRTFIDQLENTFVVQCFLFIFCREGHSCV